MEKRSVDEILDFAIAAEVAANRFYLELAAKMETGAMRKALEEFAEEELKHKAILEGVKQGGAFDSGDVADLKIADYVVDVEPRPDMDYQEALILAMKREKAAFRLYSEMAATTTAYSKAWRMLLKPPLSNSKVRYRRERAGPAAGNRTVEMRDRRQ